MKLSEHFSSSEFRCRCGCGLEEVDAGLLTVLEAVRNATGLPVIINSGRRCNGHNREVGGKPNSAHLRGTAADVSVRDAGHRFALVAAAITAGANGVGVGKTFVHIDVDADLPRPAIWGY